MSLPFLKPKKMAGIIMEHRKKDGGFVSEPEDKGSDGMHAAAEALLAAIEAKDAAAVAAALKDAMAMMDSEPSEVEEDLGE